MRKAAADTLTALVDAVAGPDPAAAAAGSAAATVAGAGSGAAALECIATEARAAVEQYLRYDRIPQVRQAAAALLRRLRHSRLAPGQHHHQRQTQPQEADASNSAAAEALKAATHAPTASPAQGLAASRSALKSLIVQRRQQLKQAVGQAQPAVQVYGGGGGDDGVQASSAAGSMAPPPAAALYGSKHVGGGGSSVGSAAADDDEDDNNWGRETLHGEAGAGTGRIRAWAGNDISEQQHPEQRQMDEAWAQQRPPTTVEAASAPQCVHYIDRPEVRRYILP